MSDIAVSETLALMSQRLAELMAELRGAAVPQGVTPIHVLPLDIPAALETLESSIAGLAVVVESLAVEREAPVDAPAVREPGFLNQWARTEMLEVLQNVAAELRATGRGTARIDRLLSLLNAAQAIEVDERVLPVLALRSLEAERDVYELCTQLMDLGRRVGAIGRLAS